MATTVIPLICDGTDGDNYANIHYTSGKNIIVVKTFLKFIIPEELYGVTPTAAELSMYLATSKANSLVMEPFATFDDWNNATSYSALDALDISSPDTYGSVTVPNTINTWYTWDVLGGSNHASCGFLKACDSSEPYTTIAFAYSSGATARADLLQLGSTDTGGANNSKSFDVTNAGYTPFVTLTHPELGGGSDIFAFSAGRVV